MGAFFEFLNLISPPCLVVIAAIGLRQLKISKDVAKVTAKRESFKLAAEQCHSFAIEIIPRLAQIDELIQKHKIKVFDNFDVIIEKEGIRYKTKKKINLDEVDLLTPQLFEVLNRMEAFSSYFVSRVADDKLGFVTVSKTFCEDVKTYLPIILSMGGGKDYYVNLVRLFHRWYLRREQQSLLEKKGEIEEKLNQADNKIIKPLGV